VPASAVFRCVKEVIVRVEAKVQSETDYAGRCAEDYSSHPSAIGHRSSDYRLVNPCFGDHPAADTKPRWTEVAGADATCGINWADVSAHHKGCRGPGQHIYHVRCERPDGNWSQDCSDMHTRTFPEMPMFKLLALFD
jgi:hypothetical protein